MRLNRLRITLCILLWTRQFLHDRARTELGVSIFGFPNPIFARLREGLVEGFLGAAKEAARIRKRLHPAKSCVMPKCTIGRLGRLEYRRLHGRSRERQCFQTFA